MKKDEKRASQSLRFTKFKVWQVVVPVRHDILAAPESKQPLYSQNLSWPELPIHMVEGETSAGFCALGESPRGETTEAVESTLRGLLGVDLRILSPATVWMTPMAGGLPSLYPLWSWQAPAGKSYPLLESLWLDAVGKAAGVPAYNLLGGAAQKRVAVDFWANRPPAKTLRKLVAEAVRLGLRGMKLKSDAGGDTVASLKAAAKDIPRGFRFTIDPMCAWRNFRSSRGLFDTLAALPFSIQIEDPFPYEVIEDWRHAREKYPMALIWHARDEATLRLGLESNVAEGFNLGSASAIEFGRTAEMVARAHKDCWQGSGLELGILQHLRLHAAASARNCILSSDLQSEWVREHTLVTPRMQYDDGHAVVPETPGLGTSLDRRAVARYCRREWVIA